MAASPQVTAAFADVGSRFEGDLRQLRSMRVTKPGQYVSPAKARALAAAADPEAAARAQQRKRRSRLSRLGGSLARPVVVPLQLTDEQAETLRRNLLAEINELRACPRSYALKLAQNKVWYGKDRDECVKSLCFLASDTQSVSLAEGLSLSAQDHCDDQGEEGLLGHEGSDGSLVADRLARYGMCGPSIAECISYGTSDPEQIISQMLIDSGFFSRCHRRQLLSPKFSWCGIGLGSHKTYGTMVVIDLAMSFLDDQLAIEEWKRRKEEEEKAEEDEDDDEDDEDEHGGGVGGHSSKSEDGAPTAGDGATPEENVSGAPSAAPSPSATQNPSSPPPSSPSSPPPAPAPPAQQQQQQQQQQHDHSDDHDEDGRQRRWKKPPFLEYMRQRVGRVERKLGAAQKRLAESKAKYSTEKDDAPYRRPSTELPLHLKNVRPARPKTAPPAQGPPGSAACIEQEAALAAGLPLDATMAASTLSMSTMALEHSRGDHAGVEEEMNPVNVAAMTRLVMESRGLREPAKKPLFAKAQGVDYWLDLAATLPHPASTFMRGGEGKSAVAIGMDLVHPPPLRRVTPVIVRQPSMRFGTTK